MPQKTHNPLSYAVLVLYVFLLQDGAKFLFGQIDGEYDRIEAAYRMLISVVILVLYFRKSPYAGHGLWLMLPIPAGMTLRNAFYAIQGQPFSQGEIVFGLLLTIGACPFLLWLRRKDADYLQSSNEESVVYGL